MIDIKPILEMFKGKGAENFRAVVEAYVKLYEQQDKKIDKLENRLEEQDRQIADMRNMLKLSLELEEKCLQQNVRANEVNRNLAEWIIFSEKRDEIREAIGKLLKG